jgi:Bacterial regulatory protein, Fis family
LTPKKKKLTIKSVAEQIERTQGNISVAARSLAVTRQTLYNYMQASEKLRGLLNDARESMKDAAESALYAAVIEKQAWAVCFTLKTLGKDRGYVEKHEIEHGGHIDVTQLSEEELRRIVNTKS